MYEQGGHVNNAAADVSVRGSSRAERGVMRLPNLPAFAFVFDNICQTDVAFVTFRTIIMAVRLRQCRASLSQLNQCLPVVGRGWRPSLILANPSKRFLSLPVKPEEGI